jgi:hypothetical protein
VETGVVTGWVVVVGSEVALVASISVVELFEGTVDVRISDKIVDVKPLVVAVDVLLEDVSGEFVGVEWVFVGVIPDAKLFVVEISVASVDPWEECAVELFGNAADVGVAGKYIYIKFLFVQIQLSLYYLKLQQHFLLSNS